MPYRATPCFVSTLFASAMLSGCLATPSANINFGYHPDTMNKAPDLQDPVLMALQNELGLRHTQIQANPDAWFTGDAVCELSSDGQWLVNFSRSEADMDALHTFRERSTGTKTEVQLGVCAAEARFWHNKPKIFRQQDV